MNNYEGVPKERIIALQNIDFDILAQEETEFRKNWKNEKKCDCVYSLDKISLPWCIHVRKAFKEKIREKENLIWKRTLVLITKTLPLNNNLSKLSNSRNI